MPGIGSQEKLADRQLGQPIGTGRASEPLAIAPTESARCQAHRIRREVHALEQHADVNAPDSDGTTALAWLAHRDDLKGAMLLIHAGANVNAANELGVTPLYLACLSGDLPMVEAFVKVDDPDTFNEPLYLIQRWRKVPNPLVETVCAENNEDHFNQGLFPIPRATKTDF